MLSKKLKQCYCKTQEIMRAITFLITILITFTSCNCQKKAVETANTSEKVGATSVTEKQSNDMKLIYEASSRGFYQKITVLNQELFIYSDRNSSEKGTQIKISETDWKEISSAMNTIKLDQLSSYKDPTQKRFYDGAAIANFKVIVNEKKYQTVDFDYGFPPVEIEKLVNKINLLAKK